MTKPTQTTKNGEKNGVKTNKFSLGYFLHERAITPPTPPPPDYANERDSSNSHKRRKIRVKLNNMSDQT